MKQHLDRLPALTMMKRVGFFFLFCSSGDVPETRAAGEAAQGGGNKLWVFDVSSRVVLNVRFIMTYHYPTSVRYLATKLNLKGS